MSIEERDLRIHRCCFTGHRPDKMQMKEDEIKPLLKAQICNAINDGFTTFITGMAPGVDIWAGEIVIELKKNNPSLKLIAAIPYPGFGKSKHNEPLERFNFVKEHSDLVKEISTHYHKGVFQQRNIWMVDHCNRVIAVYNGTPGGTRNTINYAEKSSVEVKLIEVE